MGEGFAVGICSISIICTTITGIGIDTCVTGIVREPFMEEMEGKEAGVILGKELI